jgi:hypothetical protein
VPEIALISSATPWRNREEGRKGVGQMREELMREGSGEKREEKRCNEGHFMPLTIDN